MMPMYLPDHARAQLEEMARAGYPLETCGLLIGLSGRDGSEVRCVAQARNVNQERAHDRYELHPDDFLKIDERARAEGLDLVGVWHSHPDHPAQPSEIDRTDEWVSEGWSYVIVSVTSDGIADLRCWRLNGKHFVEEPIKPCPR
jgi:proteasome lid subunit RPN8/RPN11